ncbi:MAG: RagB/SusD family nutrient uptake outer membrane protein [Pedobacter sp.]|nr:MAG: RagB/SusD family nutrient uptake outer membrane protein [Pedobacter sp.]
MKYIKYLCGFSLAFMTLVSCKKDVLDRPPLTDYTDSKFWRNEDDVRLFVNGYYTQYFNGYNSSFTVDYTPVRGYTFNDDLTGKNVQSNFESSVPTSRGSSTEGAEWMAQYGGPTWNFAWVRRSNILIDRIDTRLKANVTPEAYNHWMAVARFFKGMEYSRLVSVFGAVPYFDKEVSDTDFDELFKDRDNRGVVMDKVYDDFKFALANMRENDGTNTLNRMVAAAFVSRFMLFEGTWQHYHGLDAARAKKYLEFAVDAANIVMNSGRYNFTRDFKSIFTSESLVGHPEVLLYRVYDAALTVTHAIGSYQNGTEVVGVDANLNLLKSFILTDGKVWQNSSVPNADVFTIDNLTKTRDPRFEATFYEKALTTSSTLIYGYKFASRDALTYIGKTYPPAWGSNTNTSDAPVIRYAEVVLNWIEAKAVLAQHLGGAAVTQADLDRSVNAIRNRPLDAVATSKGLTKTAALQIGNLPVDPARDADVPALIWEIRRERRMEFVFEFARLHDIKRWKKLNYMNYDLDKDHYYGPWVNLSVEAPQLLNAAAATARNVVVRKADGTEVVYDGTNAAAMVGFFKATNAQNRNAFTDRSYLAPVGQSQIIQYQERGYTLTQSPGW